MTDIEKMDTNEDIPIEFPEVEKKYDDLVWKTRPRELNETVQFSDNYVVHGRGFLIENDVWFDEYTITGGHMPFYNEYIRHHYDKPEYPGDWPEHVRKEYEGEDVPLYWSTTGAGSFLLQHPRYSNMDSEAWHRLYLLLEDMDADPTQPITIFREPPGSDGSHAQSILRALDSDVDKTVTFTYEHLKQHVERNL